MSYGTFESVETDGYDQQQRQAAVAQDLAVAMERVARQFGPYLNQASDKDDFNDRVAFVKPEMMKVVQAAGVMPVTGVMRKVVGAQRSAWREPSAGKNAPRKTLAWRGVDQDAAQRFVQYATQNGVILKDWAHLEQLLDSFYLRDSEPWSQVDKTSFMIELRNNKDEVINAMRGSGVYASKVAFTMDDYERFYDDSDPKMREWVAQDPENRMVPANPFTNLQDFYNWKNAGKTGDGLEDAKDLIPEDNWDGYLKERETKDTNEVRNNFASVEKSAVSGADMVGKQVIVDDGDTITVSRYDADKDAIYGENPDPETDRFGYQNELGPYFKGEWREAAKTSADHWTSEDDTLEDGRKNYNKPDTTVDWNKGIYGPDDDKKESSRRTANDEFAHAVLAYGSTPSPSELAERFYSFCQSELHKDPFTDNSAVGDLRQYLASLGESDQYNAVREQLALDGVGTYISSRRRQASDDDEPTTGEPTKPNTLNDDVLEGVEEGDEGKVSDNIETNSGDGSDSKGEKRSYRAASRQRKAGAGFTWENDGIGGYDLYGSPVNGGDVEDPHAEIFDDGEDGFRVYVYKTEYDSGEMRDEIPSLEEAKSWAEGKMMEYSGGGAQTSLFSRRKMAGEKRSYRRASAVRARADRAFESAVLRTADDALVNYIDTH